MFEYVTENYRKITGIRIGRRKSKKKNELEKKTKAKSKREALN